MLVTVTGAAGHIGGNLVRALLERGDRVRAVVRSDTRALDGLPVERFAADVLDPASLRAAVDGAEVVFHLAARISITWDDRDEVLKLNVLGPRNVVAACRDAGVRRLVHFSSVHAFHGHPPGGVVDETGPSADVPGALPYDRSKALGEREVLGGVAAGLDAVIVNPTGVLGPYDFKPSRFGEAMLQMYHRTVPGLVAGGFDWVDARDVAASAIAASERGRTGEKYLLGGRRAEVPEVSALIAEVTGRRTVRFVTPTWLALAAAPLVTGWSRLTGRRPLYTSQAVRMLTGHAKVSCDKAMRELGHAPRPLDQTVADTFAWFEAAGSLRFPRAARLPAKGQPPDTSPAAGVGGAR